MIDFKGHRFEKDIILTCVRWYLAYPLSYRNLEEMMEERGVEVDHSNIYRWVQKFTPQLEAAVRKKGYVTGVAAGAVAAGAVSCSPFFPVACQISHLIGPDAE